MATKWTVRCFNPLKKKIHKSLNTRCISENLLSLFPTLSKELRICAPCRKELSELKEIPASNVDDIDQPKNNVILDKMIDDFENDDNDPDFVEPETSKTQRNDKYHKVAVEVLDPIKDKFKSSTSRAEKIQLLTLAPKSWSCRQLMVVFKTSER